MKSKSAWLDRLFLGTFRPYLWIAGLGCLVYSKTLFFGLTFLDDNVVILENFFIIKNPLNLLHSFQQVILPAFGAFYRPLSLWPYILSAQIGGPAPYIYHLTSLLLHLTAACLLFVLLSRLGYEAAAALFGALFFVVHPALASAVAWIPGGVDVLLTIFVLAALIFFIDYLKTGQTAAVARHLCFFTLALLTKEVALIIIPICPLYFYLLSGRPKKQWRVLLWPFFGSLVIGCLWFFVRRALLTGPALLTTGNLVGSLFNPAAFLLYFGKAVFPFNLAPLPTLLDSAPAYGFSAAVAIFALLLFAGKKRRGLALFGLLWFILFLLPGLVFSDPSLFTGVALYEHRLYLPLIGVIILLLEGARGRAERKVYWAAGAAVIIVFSLLTFIHLDIFHDRLSFWQAAAEASPHHPLAHRNLGAMYYLAGELGPAEREYQRTLQLNPAEPMVHNNLGLVYMNTGRMKQAEEEFVQELRLNPNYDNALFNLGLLYAREGRFELARACWEKTLQVNPGYSDARDNLRLLDGR
jgi:protein O-mannosyl-transferase